MGGLCYIHSGKGISGKWEGYVTTYIHLGRCKREGGRATLQLTYTWGGVSGKVGGLRYNSHTLEEV